MQRKLDKARPECALNVALALSLAGIPHANRSDLKRRRGLQNVHYPKKEFDKIAEVNTLTLLKLLLRDLTMGILPLILLAYLPVLLG